MDPWVYKPAGDAGLRPDLAAKSLRREAGLPSLIGQGFWEALARAYFAVFHRLKIEGQPLPARPPFIMVANHTSHLDALVLACALPLKWRAQTFPIAAGDTFFTKPVTAFFAAFLLNALPMWRKKCGPHALETLRERLIDESAIYILFPEGTRSRDGHPGPFKPGIGRLVAGTSVPVIPCHLKGCFEALPPEAKRPKPARIVLKIGQARQFGDIADDHEGWKQVAKILSGDVQALAK